MMQVIDNGKDETVLVYHDGQQLKIPRIFLQNITSKEENFRYLLAHAMWREVREEKVGLPCPGCGENLDFLVSIKITYGEVPEQQAICPFCLEGVRFSTKPKVTVESFDVPQKPEKACEPKYEDM